MAVTALPPKYLDGQRTVEGADELVGIVVEITLVGGES